MDGEKTWILDIEANGAHPGEIIELAAVEMDGLVLTGRYREWRFRPIQPVIAHATRVHGITNKHLRYSPRITEHVDEIAEMLTGHAIAGHAVHVELNALQRVLPNWSPPKAYDTLRIVRQALPDLDRHRLTSVGEHLGLNHMAARLTGKKAHSALYDALLCGLIMRRIVHPLDADERKRILDHAEIMEIRRKRALNDERKAAKAALRRSMRQPL